MTDGEQPILSRRDFLKFIGAAFGAGALAACGPDGQPLSPTQQPATADTNATVQAAIQADRTAQAATAEMKQTNAPQIKILPTDTPVPATKTEVPTNTPIAKDTATPDNTATPVDTAIPTEETGPAYLQVEQRVLPAANAVVEVAILGDQTALSKKDASTLHDSQSLKKFTSQTADVIEAFINTDFLIKDGYAAHPEVLARAGEELDHALEHIAGVLKVDDNAHNGAITIPDANDNVVGWKKGDLNLPKYTMPSPDNGKWEDAPFVRTDASSDNKARVAITVTKTTDSKLELSAKDAVTTQVTKAGEVLRTLIDHMRDSNQDLSPATVGALEGLNGYYNNAINILSKSVVPTPTPQA